MYFCYILFQGIICHFLCLTEVYFLNLSEDQEKEPLEDLIVGMLCSTSSIIFTIAMFNTLGIMYLSNTLPLIFAL